MSLEKLLSPLQLGKLILPNRVFMAPLTRQRAAQPGNLPTALNTKYYVQRASAGLIISEASQIMPEGMGYAWTPGIHTDEQQTAWKNVTDAVHAAGGHMALQLWHVGRISHSLLQPNGQAPVAPSALRAKAQSFVIHPNGTPGMVDTDIPRALSVEELPNIIAAFRAAARRAVDAGFDLVEIHAGNGYLLNQFLATNSNQRTDDFGGSIENRARFPLKVVDAIVAEIGADRVGIRLSPFGIFNDINETPADAETMAFYLMDALQVRQLAYVHIAEPDWAGGPQLHDTFRQGLRQRYRGVLIFAGGYTADKAEALIAAGTADAIAFGRSFIANPDLPQRFAQGAALNALDPSTLYGGSEKGYTDYPTLGER